jgi:outer membrane lipoprotein SlyB
MVPRSRGGNILAAPLEENPKFRLEIHQLLYINNRRPFVPLAGFNQRDSLRRNGYIAGSRPPKNTDLSLRRLALPFVLFPLTLAGCKQVYSPNTYAASAAQAEATVQRGIIIGVRQVMISANGTIGAATGGAVGGVAGSQIAGAPVVTALGAIGGTLVGGISGAAAAQAVGDTKGWEYIVQETGDKLISVTQTSKTALPIGLNVLVIAGTQQARIVPDYTVQVAAAPPAATTGATETSGAPNGTTYEIHVSPTLPASDAADTVPAAPTPAPVADEPVNPPPAETQPAPQTTPAQAKPVAPVVTAPPATSVPAAAP